MISSSAFASVAVYAVLIAVSYLASIPLMWLGRKAVGLLRL